MEGYFGGRRRIGLKDSVFLPFCLVFLLARYEGISFFGLQSSNVRKCCKQGSRGVLTPFNSFVLEIVAVSKALAVASTAAMVAAELLTLPESAP